MVWESHQFQWALKTELLVACALSLCRPPPSLYPDSLALLSIHEPIASRGNDGCKPSRTCFPISRKNTVRAPVERICREKMCRERNALRNINVSAPFFLLQLTSHINATRSRREKKIDYGFTHLSEVLKRHKFEKHTENIKGFTMSLADLFR